MSFVQLFLRNDVLYQCCLSRMKKLWQHKLLYSAMHFKHFSLHSGSIYHSAVSQLQVELVRSSSVRMKHDSHLQAAVQQTSKSSAAEMSDTHIPVGKTMNEGIANFLREVSVICEKVSKLGLQPSTQWEDRSSIEFVHELRDAVASLTPLALFHIVMDLPSFPEMDNFLRQLILSQLGKSMRHLTVSQLLRAVQSPNLDQSICGSAMHLLEQRWVEIKTSRDVVTLLYIASDNSTHFLDRLEDRALDLCDTMTAKELYRMVYCLARRQRRNTPLLRALMYCLDRQPLDLNPVHLSNLAYAMAVLNVHDQGVMEKLIKAVCRFVEIRMHPPNVICHMLSSVIRSLGILRWYDKHFVDVAVEQLTCTNVEMSDLVRLLLTLASINYLPSQLGKNGLLDIVKQIASLSESSSVLWLDAVWSCCVLNSLSPELASSVLCPEFIAKLEGTDGVEPASFAAKLLAVNAVAHDTLPGYTEPHLTDSAVDRLNRALTTRMTSRNDMFNSVVSALSEIAPASNYLRTNVMVPSGHVIDVLMLVDDHGDPQPFAKDKSVPAVRIPPSKRIHRMAFQILDFSDMVSGGKNIEPTGPNLLALRCFTTAGYKVVQVAYNEFDVKLPVVKRVRYLTQKVRNAIAQDFTYSEPRRSEISSKKPVLGEENVLEVAMPEEDVKSGDFLRHLLKSDSFFSPDVEKISEGTSDFSSGDAESSFPDSGTRERKERARRKKSDSVVAELDSAAVAKNGNTILESSSLVTSDKQEKIATQKKKTKSSGVTVKSIFGTESSTVTESLPVTEAKTENRRKKTQAKLSDELAKSS